MSRKVSSRKIETNTTANKELVKREIMQRNRKKAQITRKGNINQQQI